MLDFIKLSILSMLIITTAAINNYKQQECYNKLILIPEKYKIIDCTICQKQIIQNKKGDLI